MSYKKINNKVTNLRDSTLEIKKKVALLSFNRNDISFVWFFCTHKSNTLDFINNNTNISVLVITGKGQAFSSGGNIKEMFKKRSSFSGTVDEVEKKYRYGIQKIPKAIEKLEIPIIAAVNGPAIGAGFDLACMCDFRIMSKNAYFAENFINLGIIPGDGGAFYLQKIIGYQ